MAIYDVNGNQISVGGDSFCISVKDFGAKGNGTANDTTAIQNALDSLASTGGVIHFPCGVYLITSAILFYSNMTLLFDEGSTILQGAAIDNLMRNSITNTVGNYDGTHDVQIIGATFDGSNYGSNNTLLGFAHSQRIKVKDCFFKNGHGGWHDLEINSSKNVLVENCDFSDTRRTGSNGESIQIDDAGASGQYPWDIKIDSTVCQYVEIKGCYFHDNTISPAIGNHTSASHKFVRVHNCIFDGNTGSRGAVNFAKVLELDIYDNTFNECTTCIGTEGATYYIHDNRFVNATTAISGSASVAHANMINGTYTA